MQDVTPPSPLRLEVTRQFGQLRFRLGASGSITPWVDGHAGRTELLRALEGPLSAALGAGGSVIFRGVTYTDLATLLHTVGFTRHL